ncbi:Choline/Carnitine O-acyltransferase [Phytophthora cinnamomi]|uniref:Choline/Carnitine O-acyltransferase n=1 Tax=Phytophthora cinnamomi TaxID=4785 RepID=UPI00355A4A44|nr:Choline/Carnitine O-acyltransferase [Phytophthora cinnamomi]
MEEAVTRQHAHPSTVYHCLYAHLKLGYTRNHLAHVFNKTEHTIGNWLQTYNKTGVFQRARTTRERKYTNQRRIWLFNYYQHHQLSYLDEALDAFRRAHGTEISKTSVWRIIHSFGLTWKVLERRAIHIKELDVFRFVEELVQVKL